MAIDEYLIVEQCSSCARNCDRYCYRRLVQLFLSSGPLNFVAINLLGPLPKLSNGHQYVMIATSRYSKLTRVIPASWALSLHNVNILFDRCIVPYGKPTYIIADNSLQFVNKFFPTMCALLRVRHLTTTAYHPLSNGQAKMFSTTIVARLQHYVAEQRKDWVAFVQPLYYAYKTQVQRTPTMTPHSLLLSRHLPLPHPPPARADDHLSHKKIGRQHRWRNTHTVAGARTWSPITRPISRSGESLAQNAVALQTPLWSLVARDSHLQSTQLRHYWPSC